MNEVVPYGRSAYLVTPIQPGQPLELAQTISRARRSDVVEVVPAAATVLVLTDGRPGSDVVEWLAGLSVAPEPPVGGRVVDIDVCYDGDDLEHVAAMCGMAVDDVITTHSAAAYRCEFCGFSPGFGYLAGLDPALVLPRRHTPRTQVPAGAVAIAGPYSAVYPAPSPGGWHLLGRTRARLWDQHRDPPALLAPGVAVRFRAVDRLSDASSESAMPADSAERSAPSLLVVSAGIATTVQDGGRRGHAAIGLTAAGAVDPAAWALVNRLVGNRPGAGAFETAGSLVVEALRPITVADSATGGVRGLAAGERVMVEPRSGTAWAYLAVRGGLAVEPVLGSRSRDTLGGVGPAAPVDGGAYGVGADPGTSIVTDHAPPRPSAGALIRLDDGPRRDWFTAASVLRLTAGSWRVGTERSRVGVRLEGPALQRSDSTAARELPSEGLVRGAMQVPPDGRPIVMLNDHPVTGGYPVIAVVDPRDLPTLAQLPSGVEFRFTTG